MRLPTIETPAFRDRTDARRRHGKQDLEHARRLGLVGMVEDDHVGRGSARAPELVGCAHERDVEAGASEHPAE